MRVLDAVALPTQVMIQEHQGNEWTYTCDEGVSVFGSFTVGQGDGDAGDDGEEDEGELHFEGERGYVMFA